MSASCECCVLSGRGLCDGQVQRSPTECGVSKVCDRETSKMRRPRPPRGCRTIKKYI
jgi:hypothetical protein